MIRDNGLADELTRVNPLTRCKSAFDLLRLMPKPKDVVSIDLNGHFFDELPTQKRREVKARYDYIQHCITVTCGVYIRQTQA